MVDNAKKRGTRTSSVAAGTQSDPTERSGSTRTFVDREVRALVARISSLGTNSTLDQEWQEQLSQLVQQALPHDHLHLVTPVGNGWSNVNGATGSEAHAVPKAMAQLASTSATQGSATSLGDEVDKEALLAAPILEAGYCLGIIVLSRYRAKDFSSSELAIAEHISAALAPFFTNSAAKAALRSKPRLGGSAEGDLQREAEISRALAAIGRILSSSLNIADVYQAFADQVATLIDFDRITLCHVDARTDTVTRAFVSGAEVPGITKGAIKPYANSTEQSIIEARRPLIIASDDSTMRDKGKGAHAWRETGFRSLVSAPLYSQGVAVGTIGLSSFRPDAFNDAHAELLGRVADQIAGTVANARLHARMAREAAEREGVARIGRVVGESLDLTTVCNRLAEEVHKLVAYDRLIVTQLNEDRGEIFDFYVTGVDVPGRPAYQPYGMQGTMTHAAALRGAPIRVVVTDDNEDDVIREYPSMESGIRLGFRSFMAVPLRVESRTIGSINLRSFEHSAFTEAHEQLLAELAAQVAPAIRNAELHHQIQEAAEERLALAEIGRMVGSAHDFSDIYDALVEQVGRLIPADRASITIQEDGDTGRVVLASGLSPEFRPAGTVFPLEGTVSGWVLEQGRSLITGIDAGKALIKEIPRLADELDAGFRSILSTPLMEAGEVVGVLHLRTSAPNTYEPRHGQVAERIAAQISGSVANLGLREALEREVSVSNALAEISRTVNSSPDIRNIFDAVGDRIRDLTGADRVSIGLIDLERSQTVHFIVWGRNVTDRRPGWVSPLKGSLAEWLAETRKPLIVDDQNIDDLTKKFPQLKEKDVASGLHSMLSVPLLVSDVVRGAVHLRATAHNAFGEREAILAERITAQIAGAIVNSEHAAEARRAAEERLALSRIGQVASSSLEFGSVFPEIAQRLSELLPTERVVVAEFDAESQSLTDRYIWGTQIEGSHIGVSYPIANSIAAAAFKSQSPLAWNRAQLEEMARKAKPETNRQDALLKSGLASAMVIPLIWQNRPYGVLSLRTKRDDAYQQRELALARQFGAQIVGAVVVSSLYSQTRQVSDERLALSEIGRIVSSSLEFANVFPDFAERLSDLIPANRVVVAEYDAVSRTFTDHHIWGARVPGDELNTSYPLGSSVAHEVFDTRRPMAWSQEELERVTESHPDDAVRMESGLRSVLAVPLIWQDHIFGILHIKSELAAPYRERELDLAGQIGAQIAGAVAVSTLYSETRRVAEERTKLSEVGRIVSSSLDFSNVFEELSGKISELLPADRIVISTFEDSTKTYVDRFVWGVEVQGSHVGLRHEPGQSLSYLEEGNREPTARNKSELAQYIDTVPGVAERFKAGLNSVMRVPLIWQDRIFGELNIRSKMDDPYGSREISIAKEIGAQIVGAVAVSTLYEEATRTAEERLALSEIGRIVSGSLDFTQEYSDLAIQLKRLLQFDRLVMSIYDPQDESFVDRFVWGLELPTNPQGGRHKLENAYVRDAFRDRRSTAWNRKELEKKAKLSKGVAEGLKRGLVSAMSVPLIWQNRVFGMMNLRSLREDAYGPHDIELAEQAAAQISGGFASAFRYEQTAREAQLRQSLAAISLAAGGDHRLDRIFAAIEPELKKLIDYDRIAVTLADSGTNTLRLVYVRGTQVQGFQEGDVVAVPPGHTSWLWQATILPNDPVEGGAMERLGLHSWIQVPLGNPSSGPIGYLSLRKASRDFYNESDKEILEQVSTYLTPGVQNAIAYQREAELNAQRERAAQLEQQARELERVNQAKSEFFSTVSHELRTPLTSVVAFADIIARNREDTLSERDINHLAIVRRNAAHLKVLINDLLDVSQIESGRMELVLRPVDLGKLLRDAGDSLSPTFENRQQELKVTLARKKLQVECDPDRLTQVVSNLLNNASKFAPSESTVELRLESKDNTAVITVTDHGPGIPHAERPNLFTPFFRVDDPAVRDVEGTGLGLAISKQLIDLHHGTIEVHDTPGGGATFVVKLPLCEA